MARQAGKSAAPTATTCDSRHFVRRRRQPYGLRAYCQMSTVSAALATEHGLRARSKMGLTTDRRLHRAIDANVFHSAKSSVAPHIACLATVSVTWVSGGSGL